MQADRAVPRWGLCHAGRRPAEPLCRRPRLAARWPRLPLSGYLALCQQAALSASHWSTGGPLLKLLPYGS